MRPFFVFASITWTVTAAHWEDVSPYTVTKQRKADRVVVEKEQGVTVFVVSSSNGIGWAKIESNKAWPMQAKVRLTYANGREWKYLEQFSIESNGITVATNLRGGLDFRSRSAEEQTKFKALEKDERQSRYGIVVRKDAEHIEIVLPMVWLAGEDGFTIRWVDLFRN